MKHRIGVIGLGMAVTPHARSLLDLKDRVEVAAAASRSPERCRAFAEHFPFPTTTDIDAVLDDPDIGAVMVLTPPASHLELVRRAAARGKHVLLEKPIEIDTARAEAAVAAAEAAGVALGMVLQYRFRDSSLALARMIGDGTLGEIAAATVSVPWWRPQAYYDEPGRGTRARDGGGVLITQAIHTLDLFLSLVGGVREVAGVAATTGLHRMECEDFAAAGLVLANGAPGALLASTAHFPGFQERIEVIGARATAIHEGEVLDVRFHDGRTERIGAPEKTGGGGDPMDFPHDRHRAVLADFLDAIEENRPPRASGRAALAVHRLIDALLESAAGGRRVTLPGAGAE